MATATIEKPIVKSAKTTKPAAEKKVVEKKVVAAKKQPAKKSNGDVVVSDEYRAMERKMAPAGAKVKVVAEGGEGLKAKGKVLEVHSIINSHGRKFYRFTTDDGKVFHLSAAAAVPAGKK